MYSTSILSTVANKLQTLMGKRKLILTLGVIAVGIQSAMAMNQTQDGQPALTRGPAAQQGEHPTLGAHPSAVTQHPANGLAEKGGEVGLSQSSAAAKALDDAAGTHYTQAFPGAPELNDLAGSTNKESHPWNTEETPPMTAMILGVTGITATSALAGWQTHEIIQNVARGIEDPEGISWASPVILALGICVVVIIAFALYQMNKKDGMNGLIISAPTLLCLGGSVGLLYAGLDQLTTDAADKSKMFYDTTTDKVTGQGDAYLLIGLAFAAALLGMIFLFVNMGRRYDLFGNNKMGTYRVLAGVLGTAALSGTAFHTMTMFQQAMMDPHQMVQRVADGGKEADQTWGTEGGWVALSTLGVIFGLACIWFLIMGSGFKDGKIGAVGYTGLGCLVAAGVALGVCTGSLGDYAKGAYEALDGEAIPDEWAGDDIGNMVTQWGASGIALVIAGALLLLGIGLTIMARTCFKK